MQKKQYQKRMKKMYQLFNLIFSIQTKYYGMLDNSFFFYVIDLILKRTSEKPLNICGT